MKFKFSSISFDNSKNILSFEAETLPEVLEEFERFLKGCGFIFDGNVDIYKDDDNPSLMDYSLKFNNPLDYEVDGDDGGD